MQKWQVLTLIYQFVILRAKEENLFLFNNSKKVRDSFSLRKEAKSFPNQLKLKPKRLECKFKLCHNLLIQ